MNVYTKAGQVEQAYYDAVLDDNISSEGCYSIAISTAIELGGIEVANSNNSNSTESFAPNVTFAFADSPSVHITYRGVFL